MYEMIPIKTITKVERKVRNLSYSHDGQYLAVTSENKSVQIFSAEPVDHSLMDYLMGQNSDSVYEIPTDMAQNCVKWNPSKMVLAFCDDDKGKHKDDSVVHLFC